LPHRVIEYRCLLISPGDVEEEERAAIADVAANWNAHIGNALDARVEIIRWESHATPDLEGPVQTVINRQLVDDCDFGLAVFWSRLGTPTAEHESGSVEEIERLLGRGAHVIVYLSLKAIPQHALQDEEYSRLRTAKERFEKQGLVANYTSTSNLREQVLLHLTTIVANLLVKDRGASRFPVPQAGGLPTPDLRLKIQGVFTAARFGQSQTALAIKVENHSPIAVFLGNVFLELKDGRAFIALQDSLTGEPQQRRRLEPGESFTFNFSPQIIAAKLSIDEIRCAAVNDDINRVYRSSEQDIQNVLAGLLQTESRASTAVETAPKRRRGSSLKR